MTHHMSRALTLLFAVAGGLAVGNLYIAQPLLDFIADDLGTNTSTAGWLVTAAQLGYALGILLIVPLGDILDRRRLIPTVLLISAAALAACALAPSFPLLVAATAALGATTVSGQLLTPLAGDLAADHERGKVVGTIVSGLLSGILLSRVVSGLVAGVAGWRIVFGAAAVAAVVLATALYRSIPTLPARPRVGYVSLIRSVGTVVARERTVRWTLALGATGFASFTLFWTALTFLLSDEPYSYSTSTIGLFGLVGLAGAIAAQRVGRLHDRGWSLPATGVACTLLVAAFAVAALGGRSVVLVLVAVLILDVAVQGLNILNQVRILSVSRQARSRLNTTFVTSNFVGGAVGSSAATLLWSVGGWTAISITGMGLGATTVAIWLVGRRGPLAAR